LTEASSARSILTELDFDHPVETVWWAMTDAEWPAVWFFPNDIQPVQGHKFTIWGRPIERWDGEFKCQVLAVEAPKMISFRWFGGHEELKGFGRYMDTTVTWTLSPFPNGGTHFRFAQNGTSADPGSDGVYEVMVKGSERVLQSLAKRLPDLIKYGA
jgi:uncharacterized protein YndB with AHSA1/START domain